MQKLTKGEEDVMQFIWTLERCTVSDILEQMGEPRPPHSTVSSVVRILERKGYVDHKAYGKTYEYFPLIDKEEYGKRSLKDVLTNYFDGSVSRLVSHLVENPKIKEEDLNEILKKLDKQG
ncbi:MAG: BlaI/MecI/CopY family transcriptional regulator [Saprospiraceae bacterium]|jgi:predicted transcriptional regulator